LEPFTNETHDHMIGRQGWALNADEILPLMTLDSVSGSFDQGSPQPLYLSRLVSQWRMSDPPLRAGCALVGCILLRGTPEIFDTKSLCRTANHRIIETTKRARDIFLEANRTLTEDGPHGSRLKDQSPLHLKWSECTKYGDSRSWMPDRCVQGPACFPWMLIIAQG
jgi:hypothetical protein